MLLRLETAIITVTTKIKEMLQSNETLNEIEEAGLLITHVFNAPRTLVFKAWTEPERLVQWWGWEPFKVSIAKLDLKAGGTFHYSIQTLEGEHLWSKHVYHLIKVPERLVFISSFSNESADITPSPKSNIWPREILNHLTLTEHKGKTKLTLRRAPLNASQEELETFNNSFNSIKQEFKQIFYQLEDYLSVLRIY